MDSALSDNFLVRGHRARLGLAGNSGEAPEIYEMLLGVGRLNNDPEQRVEVTFDQTTKTIATRAIPNASDVTMPDGSTARKIVVDQRDAGALAKIITRERKRAGATPISPEALESQVISMQKSVTTIENPTLIF